MPDLHEAYEAQRRKEKELEHDNHLEQNKVIHLHKLRACKNHLLICECIKQIENDFMKYLPNEPEHC